MFARFRSSDGGVNLSIFGIWAKIYYERSKSSCKSSRLFSSEQVIDNTNSQMSALKTGKVQQFGQPSRAQRTAHSAEEFIILVAW